MSEGSPSFVVRGRTLLQQLLHFSQTRLEMVGLAVEQERLALGREIRLAAICVVCAWLAGTTLVLWLVILLPQQVLLWLLGAMFAVFAAGGLTAGMVLKHSAHREPLFSRLVEQLKLDRAAFGPEHEAAYGHEHEKG